MSAGFVLDLESHLTTLSDGRLIWIAEQCREDHDQTEFKAVQAELKRRADVAYQLADAWARSVPGTPHGVAEPVKAVQHGS